VGRFACVTMSVQQLQIVVALIPTLGFRNEMIDFEGIILREVQPTCAAASLLFAQVSCHAEADGRMTAQACAPIHPIAIIRTPGGLDFHMAADGRVGVQREGASFQRWLEAPAFALIYPPVFAHDPVLGLIRMAGHGPTAQLRIERMV
jgi:hypothetical protein